MTVSQRVDGTISVTHTVNNLSMASGHLCKLHSILTRFSNGTTLRHVQSKFCCCRFDRLSVGGYIGLS